MNKKKQSARDSTRGKFASSNDNKSIALILVIFISLLPQIYKLFLPIELLSSGFISDDAYYYYKVALNIRKGFGSTFDTINFTNGYHPLWMLALLLPTYISTDLHIYLYLALSLNLVFVAILSATSYIIFRNFLGPVFGALLVFLMNWNYLSGTTYFSGLETPLYLLLLVLSIDYMTRISFSDYKSCAKLGALMGITFLARTEFVLFLPLFSIYYLTEISGRKRIRILISASIIISTFSLFSLPYLLFNYFTTGHFQQISGLVKDLHSAGQFSSFVDFKNVTIMFAAKIMESIAMRPRKLTLFLFAFLPYFIYFMVRNPSFYKKLFNQKVFILAIYSIMTTLYYFVKYGDQTRYWHLATAIFTFQLLYLKFLGEVYNYYSQNKVNKNILISILLISFSNYFMQVGYFTYKYTKITNYHFTALTYYQHEAAEWMRNNLQEDATVGTWNAGYVGYFSQKKVINLDGLINGTELLEYMKDGRGVYSYILDNKIEYVSDYYFGEPVPPKHMGDRLELIHHIGRKDVIRNGNKTYVDWYVWKVKFDE